MSLKKLKKAMGLSEHEIDRVEVIPPVDPDKRRRSLISVYGEAKGERLFLEELENDAKDSEA